MVAHNTLSRDTFTRNHLAHWVPPVPLLNTGVQQQFDEGSRGAQCDKVTFFEDQSMKIERHRSLELLSYSECMAPSLECRAHSGDAIYISIFVERVQYHDQGIQQQLDHYSIIICVQYVQNYLFRVQTPILAFFRKLKIFLFLFFTNSSRQNLSPVGQLLTILEILKIFNNLDQLLRAVRHENNSFILCQIKQLSSQLFYRQLTSHSFNYIISE